MFCPHFSQRPAPLSGTDSPLCTRSRTDLAPPIVLGVDCKRSEVLTDVWGYGVHVLSWVISVLTISRLDPAMKFARLKSPDLRRFAVIKGRYAVEG